MKAVNLDKIYDRIKKLCDKVSRKADTIDDTDRKMFLIISFVLVVMFFVLRVLWAFHNIGVV